MTIAGDLNYTFTLTVKKDKRSCKASVYIEIRGSETPLIGIDNPRTYLNPNENNDFILKVFSK